MLALGTAREFRRAPTLQVIAARSNISRQLHMPAQSGSTAMLARMRRGYTRDAYDALVERIRAAVPGVAFSTDIIVGEAQCFLGQPCWLGPN